jgi:hypothetical protein
MGSEAMIIYRAEATWDDGQICSNGYAALGLFARLESARAACEASGGAMKWEAPMYRSGALLEAFGSKDGKAYFITEMKVID